MLKYEISLKNERARAYIIISWLIIIICLFAFAFLAINESAVKRYVFLSAVVLLIGLAFYQQLNRKPKQEKRKFNHFFAVIVLAWLTSEYYLLAAISLLLYFLQGVASRKLELAFYTDKVVYPGFPVRTMRWNDFSNIILKDGLLTLDYKNNRISQYLIEENSNTPDEKEFNEFCTQQLRSVAAV